MKKQTVVVLLATRSTSLRDGMAALLSAIPQIDEVEIFGSLEAALLRIKSGTPQLVFMDRILLGNTPETVLEEIHLLSPETQRVILVGDLEEVKGASHHTGTFLMIGSLPSAIADVITKLLNLSEDNDRLA